MNKSQLISSIHEKTDLTKKDIDLVLDAFINTVYETLKSADKVTLSGFGTFEPKHRPERNGVNPKTGEKIIVPESTVPSFKAGKTFKETLKGNK
ncbi:HU family DNA-binding protein [Haloplasma contractile]|uniref:DNA binding protein HU n=1 Tax=Haloplasma contractile SSD-17B TaxID=1033810 RepID=F7Q179_9MOLU|nr:HU family DNA-binding protein [Haloplasma contractile]ERJ12796.1 DNA binding protein HU [Haloplasma contractile SSD-17B]